MRPPDDCLVDLHKKFLGLSESEAGVDNGVTSDASKSTEASGNGDGAAGGENEPVVARKPDGAQPAGTSAPVDDSFEQARERQIAANREEMIRLGLITQPVEKRKPKPRKRTREPTAQKPVSTSDRELRSRCVVFIVLPVADN